MHRFHSLLLPIVGALAIALAFSTLGCAQDAGQAGKILNTSGIKHGLCILLGCGSQASPDLTAELAANSRLLVHGLAADDAALARARKGVESQGLLGRASVEKLPLDPLPYLRDLANLVVIEDLAALSAGGLKMEEALRILAPAGVLMVKKDGQWTKSIKPRPQEMDDWTHPTHGADGNQVSSDRVVQFPVGLRWQDGVPMNFNLWAACRGWVIAGGRCFTLSTTELENIGPTCCDKHKQEEYVTARDAFNGLPLWKVNCGTTNAGKALNNRATAPIVTDGRRVYAYCVDRLAALEADSGQAAVSYAVKYPTARLMLADGVVVASGWENKEEAKEADSGRSSLWSYWVNKSSAGSVEAFDAASGKLKWSLPQGAQEMLAAEGAAYVLMQVGNPATQQEILALDLQTGRPRWKAGHTRFAEEPGLRLNTAGCGVLVIQRPKAKSLSILAADTGNLLWEIKPADRTWSPLVAGQLWYNGKKYDPKTGNVLGKLPASVEPHICTPSAVVGNIVTATRGGQYYELPADHDAKDARATLVRYAATRGACIEGATPANGMFYSGQNNCRCTPGQVPGFVAFGPSGPLPAAADFEKPRPIEKGPAFGAVKPSAPSAGDWPMFRHNAQRSGATAVQLPAKLQPQWHAAAVSPADGPLAAVWKSRLASCMTGPTVAEGRVFVAAIDLGQVVALDAATGKPAWQFTAGGRIDSPPTIYQGLCLFGSHDGWVYALRASDGQLAWRTRVAPWERRMVAFGQMESVWPALGSVLVHDGVVYASAGRTMESDGGLAVCALDPANGQSVWSKAIGPGPARENDLLAVKEGKLALYHVNFDPKSGASEVAKTVGRHSGTLEGFIDGSWTRIGNRRSGNLNLGRVMGDLLVWTDQVIYGYQGKAPSAFAITMSKTEGTEKLVPQDYTWRMASPQYHHAEAMVLCGSGLVLAGRTVDPNADREGGFLCLVSTQDGKPIVEVPLDAPPAYEGLAVANGCVYVSLSSGRVVCFR